ncbi:MAG: restriction endonuclease subunit R [Candidatus Staskawiczbacteria bacterium]|nr:restriction endonuclease subunit R [Candidatus Staskawiczbacteria bacterium]
MIKLKPFQEKAITNLRKQFLDLWKTGKKRRELIFKSPTGSGKTVMIAQFLKDLTGDPQFDVDKAFVWFSFNEESYLQSKKKLFDYYGGASELNLFDYTELITDMKLEKNNVFFINWQKVKSSSKEGRVLRNPTEKTNEGLFDDLIINTQKSERDLILIVDEAHRDTDTDLAEELIDLIDPRIILKITATPKKIPNALELEYKEKAFINVDREEVIEAELIKEKIITQTKEDLEKHAKNEIDQDILLLNLAYEKRKDLIKLYNHLNKKINPLVLIQLPNDDWATKGTLDKSKEEIVREYLREKGVRDHEVAVWLSDKKENLEEIEKNDSEVNFLVFKQAAATGWDCPRASILIMFREIKNPVFHTQTVGRILRMPEAKYYPNPELNKGYLYTNYDRNVIVLPDSKQSLKNKPFIFSSFRKEGKKAIFLESTFMSRADYNDLGDSFQGIFEKTANNFLGIKENDSKQKIKEKLKEHGLDLENLHIENKLIADVEIEDFDNFVKEIIRKGVDLTKETSKNDLQRMYNLICFDILAKQEEENRRFGPERSWGKLKSSLNVWISKLINEKRDLCYILIVKNLIESENSTLRKIIGEALEKYRSVREREVQHKASRTKTYINLKLPQDELQYTEDYEIIKKDVSKCAMEPFYLQKEYSGKENEARFRKYLESKEEIEWWHKNGDEGSEYFAIPYFDWSKGRERLFYPDWIVLLKSGKVLIMDTKKGDTAKSDETKNKAKALQIWLKEKKEQKNNYDGGIIVEFSNIWKINRNDNYVYDDSGKDFEYLEILFGKQNKLK